MVGSDVDKFCEDSCDGLRSHEAWGKCLRVLNGKSMRLRALELAASAETKDAQSRIPLLSRLFQIRRTVKHFILVSGSSSSFLNMSIIFKTVFWFLESTLPPKQTYDIWHIHPWRMYCIVYIDNAYNNCSKEQPIQGKQTKSTLISRWQCWLMIVSIIWWSKHVIIWSETFVNRQKIIRIYATCALSSPGPISKTMNSCWYLYLYLYLLTYLYF